jgi:O-antigen ligase
VAERLPAPALGLLALLAGAGVLGLGSGVDPALAVAGSLAIAFMLVALASLTAGFVLFTMLTFLEVLPGLGGPALSVGKLAGLLVAISWLATVSARGGERTDFIRARPGLAYLLALFLVWSLLSQLWAEDPGTSLTATLRYALNLAIFPIVFAVVQERSHAFWIVGAFAGGALVAALYGLATPPDPNADLDRIAGTIGDPNQLAAVLVAGGALAIGLAGVARAGSAWRPLALSTGGVCLLATFFTLSRGGLIAMGCALGAGLLLAGRWRPRAALIAAVASLAAIGYFGSLASPAARDRVVQSDGGTGRTDVWEVGWRMVEANPVTGIGAGNFEGTSVHYLLEPGAIQRDEFIVDTPRVAHNLYLQILSELGAVGLVLFSAIVLCALACALAAARQFARDADLRMELLARCLAIALVGLLAADFFISDQFSKQLWLLLALGPALLAMARRESRGFDPSTDLIRGQR